MKLENLDALCARLCAFAQQNISDDVRKTIEVDTKLYHHEMNKETLQNIQSLAPFGQGNEEPLFLIEDMTISNVEKV